jgi:hypothetical protein
MAISEKDIESIRIPLSLPLESKCHSPAGDLSPAAFLKHRYHSALKHTEQRMVRVVPSSLALAKILPKGSRAMRFSVAKGKAAPQQTQLWSSSNSNRRRREQVRAVRSGLFALV